MLSGLLVGDEITGTRQEPYCTKDVAEVLLVICEPGHLSRHSTDDGFSNGRISNSERSKQEMCAGRHAYRQIQQLSRSVYESKYIVFI